MTRVCVIVILLLGTLQSDCDAQTTLCEHLKIFSGEAVQQLPTPTIRAAAQEYIIGRQFELVNEYGIAIAHYKKATELDDRAYAPWVGIANSLTAMGRFETAVAVWREVLSRNQSHGEALLVVGLDDTRVGDLENARRWLSRRRLQDKDDPVESLLRDSALLSVLKKQNNQEVMKLLQENFQLTFDSAVTTLIDQNNRGNWVGVMQQLVDVGAASIAVQVATAATPYVDGKNLSALLTALPLLEVASFGDGSLTLEIYRKVSLTQDIPLAPRWFEPVSLAAALSMAAQSMSVLGAIEAPIKLYESSLAIEPNDSLTANNLAWMRLNRDGATKEVMELCNRAFELQPDAPFIMDTLGWMYVVTGKPEKAIPLFVGALELESQPSPETYVHLGDAYWLAGESDKAIHSWRTAWILLNAAETRQAYLEGYMSMAYSVWGISVATPEALYDLELGELTRNLMEKITAFENENFPKVSGLVELDGAK